MSTLGHNGVPSVGVTAWTSCKSSGTPEVNAFQSFPVMAQMGIRQWNMTLKLLIGKLGVRDYILVIKWLHAHYGSSCRSSL